MKAPALAPAPDSSRYKRLTDKGSDAQSQFSFGFFFFFSFLDTHTTLNKHTSTAEHASTSRTACLLCFQRGCEQLLTILVHTVHTVNYLHICVWVVVVVVFFTLTITDQKKVGTIIYSYYYYTFSRTTRGK